MHDPQPRRMRPSKATPSRRNKIGVQYHAQLGKSAWSLLPLSRSSPSPSLFFGKSDASARRHRRGGDAQSRTRSPCRCRWPRSSRRRFPIYLDYSARTEVDPQYRAAGQGVRLSSSSSTSPDGTDVKEGDLLYTIDPRDLQAALDQAKAQVQRDMAALDYARSNLERGIHARQERLPRQGHLRPAHQRARGRPKRRWRWIEAAVRTAELNLGYTEIRAPFAGRLGRNQASVGTLISVAGAPLNTLVQLDPIYVTFNPERDGPRRDPEGARRRARSPPTFYCRARPRRATAAS